MEFEYDPAKSAANLDKHGIDFKTALALWQDDNIFELVLPFEGEYRKLVIGKIEDRYWTAVITYRLTNVRIISVRRARPVEIACYEG